MSDAPVQIAAQEKHPCPACGAQAEWSPAKQKLVCPFCGTESPYVIPKETGTIAEIDLLATLNELPEEQRGWNTERRSVQCQSCKAIMVFDPAKVGQNCEFCGSPALVAYEEIKSPIRPQSLLPFKISQDQVRDRITGWYASKWFAPGALKHKALVDQIKGLYIPYWTFDAQVHCRWQAEAGYYYFVTEEYRDNEGHTQVRQVRQVRWEPTAGELGHFFDDEPVPGTKGLDLTLLRGVEPFPTEDLCPTTRPSFRRRTLSGRARRCSSAVARPDAPAPDDACGQQMPGDTFRASLDPTFPKRTFKHARARVAAHLHLGPKTFQVIANGATGTIAAVPQESVEDRPSLRPEPVLLVSWHLLSQQSP